ncbi:hypothetical protein A5886_000946 [Enterococcus sp. 8G7_MSG3316]|uniref:Uncharacterized protein n=1 Tax=Candidatus Enterococcus testudinis TaxID=1834191 RepID=A0A242A4P7_9ENTE|nr:hypothetical protein A5886_000946 [Enterococcus sp. 8G7_MSG3316]
MDNCTKKHLGLTDEHLIFEEDWLDSKQEGCVLQDFCTYKEVRT